MSNPVPGLMEHLVIVVPHHSDIGAYQPRCPGHVMEWLCVGEELLQIVLSSHPTRGEDSFVNSTKVERNQRLHHEQRGLRLFHYSS